MRIFFFTFAASVGASDRLNKLDRNKRHLRGDLFSDSISSEDNEFWSRFLDAEGSMSTDSDSSDDDDKSRINPCGQPLFQETVPNALDPGFTYTPDSNNGYVVQICKNTEHETGLIGQDGTKLKTPIYGYGEGSEVCTWPGKTFEVQSFANATVRWENNLPIEEYLITNSDGVSVVDTSLHWAYSLPGYEDFSIPDNGVPIVPHLHGGHTDAPFDGNPEFFFSPGFEIKGPRWVAEEYVYDNSQPATTSWYHDHALGITRLNVYTGLAGFYIIRDEQDTGKSDNPLGLPAFPYEAAFALQDHMFKPNGEHFYPAFPGDPFYEDFIDGEGAELPDDQFPNGGPSALAEFFGDVMLVNGKIWPKMEVEPRNYRLRLLNGCDSRFLIIQFFVVDAGEIDFSTAGSDPTPFTVISDDHGIVHEPATMDTLLVEPGSRYGVIFNFKDYAGSRVIMKNIGPDEPFSGDADDFGFPREGTFCYTDRIMAFDVVKPFDDSVPDNFNPDAIGFPPTTPEPTRTRQLALFEGLDEFGRLQPLQGVIGPATDANGDPILWPDAAYRLAGLAGKPIEGTVGWHSPTTENPRLDSTEEWEIWNVSGDAHPVHVHMAFFEVIGRNEIKWDSATEDDERVIEESDATGDGAYLQTQPVVQHNGELGEGFRVVNPTKGDAVDTPSWYFEDGPKDTIVAMPGWVTRIKIKFDKPGRFVWHCHILAHEDHEMMRPYFVSVEG